GQVTGLVRPGVADAGHDLQPLKVAKAVQNRQAAARERRTTMRKRPIGTMLVGLACAMSFVLGWMASKDGNAASAQGGQGPQLAGKVQGAGSPIAGSTVTLYAAGEGKPTQLAQGKTNDDGGFRLDIGADKVKGTADKVLYLVARGGTPKADGGKGLNDAIALLAVLGTKLPKKVTVNEPSTPAPK